MSEEPYREWSEVRRAYDRGQDPGGNLPSYITAGENYLQEVSSHDSATCNKVRILNGVLQVSGIGRQRSDHLHKTYGKADEAVA